MQVQGFLSVCTGEGVGGAKPLGIKRSGGLLHCPVEPGALPEAAQHAGKADRRAWEDPGRAWMPQFTCLLLRLM